MIPLAVIAIPPSQASTTAAEAKSSRPSRTTREPGSKKHLKLPTSSSSTNVHDKYRLEQQAPALPLERFSTDSSGRSRKPTLVKAKSRSNLKSSSTSTFNKRRQRFKKTKAKLGDSLLPSYATKSGRLSLLSTPSSTPTSPRSPSWTFDRDENIHITPISAARTASSGTAAAAPFSETTTAPINTTVSPFSSPPRLPKAKDIPEDLSQHGNLGDSVSSKSSDDKKEPLLPAKFYVPYPASTSSKAIPSAPDRLKNNFSRSKSSIPDFPLPGQLGSCKELARPKTRHVDIIIPGCPIRNASPDKEVKNSPITPVSSIFSQPLISPASSSLSPVSMSQHLQNGGDGAISSTRGTLSMDSQQQNQQPHASYSHYNQYPQHHNNQHQYHSHRTNGDLQPSHTHAYESHSGTSQPHALEESFHAGTANHVSQTPASVASSAGTPSVAQQTAGVNNASTSATSSLSGLVCNVHRTTGREPHALVGASTTILGDKLYVFGGRRLSRSRPFLTSDLYELDLIRRHWTKLETRGDVPAPRYFHSVCALGDTKLVCYGGMSPQAAAPGQHAVSQQSNGDQNNGKSGNMNEQHLAVMSDVHIYDILTRTWMLIPSHDVPQGRYAHCAAILPSAGVFSSQNAPLSAIHHNPSSPQPNQGTIGVSLDGYGGAEMVVVGGQDKENQYIEQISVFNLRSLRWTATNALEKSCGAYRSVVTPLTAMRASEVGAAAEDGSHFTNGISGGSASGNSNKSDNALLIYSNYNFMQVKLELQVRLPDGSLIEKPMHSHHSPPGLRFPNGGVIANHFVVSGTFLTPSEQEYAMWALDLRTLSWSRIDAGGSIFRHGSWNRGLLWNRRNMFIVLGNRKRRLVEDYNHRRINFSNICTVELEAFGLYDNPRRTEPTSGYISSSCAAGIPSTIPSPPSQMLPQTPPPPDMAGATGGRYLPRAAQELGDFAMASRELCDMDFLAIDGTRIPVNSRLVARRWGPYFTHLLREGAAAAAAAAAAAGEQAEGTGTGTDTATLRPSAASQASRNSSLTITQSVKTAFSVATTLAGSDTHGNNTDRTSVLPIGANNIAIATNGDVPTIRASSSDGIGDPTNPYVLQPTARPRTLYLPHTKHTLYALITYLYTSALPYPSSATNSSSASSIMAGGSSSGSTFPLPSSVSQAQLCTPQVLCSLLQIARPYRIDGLLEAVVERLHAVLDRRNTAAIFNAAAMAAGGGDGVQFYSAVGGKGSGSAGINAFGMADLATLTAAGTRAANGVSSSTGAAAAGNNYNNNLRALPSRINTSVSRATTDDEGGERSAGGISVSASSIASGSVDGDSTTHLSHSQNHHHHHHQQMNPQGHQGHQSYSTTYPASDVGSSSASAISGVSGVSSRRNARDVDLDDEEVWSGETSAVVGLQKRGLRGLMEGRRMRERSDGGDGGGRVGLGIA